MRRGICLVWMSVMKVMRMSRLPSNEEDGNALLIHILKINVCIFNLVLHVCMYECMYECIDCIFIIYLPEGI